MLDNCTASCPACCCMVFQWFFGVLVFSMVFWCYLRPVRGCTSGGCDRAGGATICLGLLTFVLDLANSNRMVCGRSGSNRTPCCKKTGVRHWCCGAPLQRAGQGWQERDVAEQPHFPGLKSWPSEANWGRKGGHKVGCFGWFSGLLLLLLQIEQPGK